MSPLNKVDVQGVVEERLKLSVKNKLLWLCICLQTILCIALFI